MKTFITISQWVGMAIVTGFLFAVASCAAGPGDVTTTWTSPADDTTWAAPATSSIDLGDIARDSYLDTLSPRYPTLTEAELLDFAGIACAALDQNSQDMLAAVEQTMGQRTALTRDLAAEVVGAAMGSFYCEHYYTAGG